MTPLRSLYGHAKRRRQERPLRGEIGSIGRLSEARCGKRFGGARRNRTDDLFNAIEALSQLSYGPTRAAMIRGRLKYSSRSVLIFLFFFLDGFADQVRDIARLFLVLFEEGRIVFRAAGDLDLVLFLAFDIGRGCFGGSRLALGLGRFFERD